MDFNKLNEKGQLADIKPGRKLTDLETDKEYKLVDIKAVTTGFGRKIIAECEEFITYLPGRFDELTDEEISDLKKSVTKWSIKYTGLKDYGSMGKTARLLEFVQL